MQILSITAVVAVMAYDTVSTYQCKWLPGKTRLRNTYCVLSGT